MNFEVTQLYNHSYNNTITNERSVEVPLGLRFLEMFNYDVIEIEMGEFLKAGGAAQCLVLSI